MCFDLNSSPPIFNRPRTQASGQHLSLVSADQARFLAFRAVPDEPSGAGVLVLPDNRGLYPFYEQLALHLAEQGHYALAIDYYGRTAGASARDEKFPFLQHMSQLKRESLDRDIETAAKYLHTAEGGACGSTFALGFCFGGRQAFFASAPRFGFTGVIGFYGAPSRYPNGAPGPIERAHELRAPVLAIFGGADHAIPLADIEGFDEALTRAGVPHEFVQYPGAPHSFFDIGSSDFQDECADAWKRVCEFVADPTSSRGNRLRVQRC
jgi:carboxymethylenebutenolidase